MSDSSTEELIRLRLEQANESLEEARTLFSRSFLRGSINRSYYAMFYSVLALGTLKQISTSKHSGLIAFFDREFIKTQVFPRELSRSLHLAFQRRQECDYGDLFSINEDEARQAINDAQAFIITVAGFLELQTGM